MKNVLIGQSGGPSCVINATLYGVIKSFKNHDVKIYGMINGIEGFIKGKYEELNELTDYELELLKTTPAMYLGSCRYKLSSDFNDKDYAIIYNELNKLNIGYFIYVGGNDSMDTANKMNSYLRSKNSDILVIGLPKTIDNDLYGLDHSPGYASSVRFILDQVQNISIDAGIYDLKSVTIIEIMGRNAGWLTYASHLAKENEKDNPLLVYVPEVIFSFDKFLKDVEAAFKINKNVVVCISEGIKTNDNHLVCEYDKHLATDPFGHKTLDGAATILADLVKETFNCKARGVILNVTQRCNASFISKVDLEEAIMFGIKGYEALLNKKTGIMIGSRRISNDPYRIEYIDVNLNDVVEVERKLDEKFLNDLSSFCKYLRPLISENVKIPSKNGRSLYIFRKNK